LLDSFSQMLKLPLYDRGSPRRQGIILPQSLEESRFLLR